MFPYLFFTVLLAPGVCPILWFTHLRCFFHSLEEAFGFILRKVENTIYSDISSLYILRLESSFISSFLHILYLAALPFDF